MHTRRLVYLNLFFTIYLATTISFKETRLIVKFVKIVNYHIGMRDSNIFALEDKILQIAKSIMLKGDRFFDHNFLVKNV